MRLRFPAAFLPALAMAVPVALPLVLATPARADQDCRIWSAARQQDEGGAVLTASVCTDEANTSPSLSLQCFGKVDLRYWPGDAAPDVEPDTVGRFSFTSGTRSIEESLQFQAMDASFAIDLDRADPLLALLRGGSDLTVADAGGKLGSHHFSLQGSGAAIGAVMAACGRPATPAADED